MLLLNELIGTPINHKNDILFWFAFAFTFLFAFLYQNINNQGIRRYVFIRSFLDLKIEKKGFWIPHLFTFTIGGFLYLNSISVLKLNSINEIYETLGLILIPICIILYQFILNILSGKIWDAHVLHDECWRIRFKYLPIILSGIPFLLWLMVWGQSLEGFIKNLFDLTAIIYLILYCSGIISSVINFLKKSTSPWYLGFSYLCALEIAPIFWALF
tara:strand:- start:139 stop:783 length:645 start_codon:yes stop_codon:yes gene_type:complete